MGIMDFFRFHDYLKAPADADELVDEPLNDEAKLIPQSLRQHTRYCCGLHPVVFIILNGLVLGFNTIFWLLNHNHSQWHLPGDDLIIPPLREILEYQVVHSDVHLGHHSPYGEDSEEADALWKEISHDGPYGWVKVDKNDLDQINQTSIQLDDGSGYLVGIEVFHELHCVNLLRRLALGREFQLEENPLPEAHLGHCVDLLRLSLQCNANLSLMPMRWIENYDWPWPVFQSTRQCRNWDNLFEWTKENSASFAGHLAHPQFGPIRPGQKPDIKQLPDLDHVKFIDEPVD